MDIFNDIGLILLVVFFISVVFKLFKQPLIIGYILAGIILGSGFVKIDTASEVIKAFSELGIASLLFVVGLGLSPKVIKDLGLVSILIGLSQLVATSAIAFVLVLALGFSFISSLIISCAITFSSTIVLLKTLTDMGDINKLYGRLSIGISLVQDIVAIFVLLMLTTLPTSKTEYFVQLAFLIIKGTLIFTVITFLTNKFISKITVFLGDSQEFLFLFSIAFAIGCAVLYKTAGLSTEIGALLAGISLSVLPIAAEISARLKPLRDFFVIMFFVLLGFNIHIPNFWVIAIPFFILFAFVIFVKPLIVLLILRFVGFTKRTSFLTSISIAQVSEFPLIVAALGISTGVIDNVGASVLTLVGVASFAASTLVMQNSNKLYAYLRGPLNIFNFRTKLATSGTNDTVYEAVIFGYKRVGAEFARVFQKLELPFYAVDFNPATVDALNKKGIECRYGDAEDVEFLQELHLEQLKVSISTIPDFETNCLVTETIRKVNTSAIVISVADTIDEAEELYSKGCTHVILPHYLGAKYVTEILEANRLDVTKHELFRENQLAYLSQLKGFLQ